MDEDNIQRADKAIVLNVEIYGLFKDVCHYSLQDWVQVKMIEDILKKRRELYEQLNEITNREGYPFPFFMNRK